MLSEHHRPCIYHQKGYNRCHSGNGQRNTTRSGSSNVRTTTKDKIQEELPEKVETLWQNSNEYSNQDERVQLRQLLHKYMDILSNDEFDIGQFQGVEHTIETGEAQPIKQRMRRTPLHFVNEEKEQLMKMLQAGVIEPSISEWASPPVLIRKSNGKVRYAIDYRKLNSDRRLSGHIVRK
jgi:hypothetical protein